MEQKEREEAFEADTRKAMESGELIFDHKTHKKAIELYARDLKAASGADKTEMVAP